MVELTHTHTETIKTQRHKEAEVEFGEKSRTGQERERLGGAVAEREREGGFGI